jgi:hypothetical protein
MVNTVVAHVCQQAAVLHQTVAPAVDLRGWMAREVTGVGVLLGQDWRGCHRSVGQQDGRMCQLPAIWPPPRSTKYTRTSLY